jgi:hypothetical protein
MEAQVYDNSEFLQRYYRKSTAVTPHDSNELSPRPKGLIVTATGNLVVRLLDSTVDLTLAAVAANTILPFRVKLVKATGTTATVAALF